MLNVIQCPAPISFSTAVSSPYATLKLLRRCSHWGQSATKQTLVNFVFDSDFSFFWDKLTPVLGEETKAVDQITNYFFGTQTPFGHSLICLMLHRWYSYDKSLAPSWFWYHELLADSKHLDEIQVRSSFDLSKKQVTSHLVTFFFQFFWELAVFQSFQKKQSEL